MDLRCLPPGVFQTLSGRYDLLVVKESGSQFDYLTEPESALYDFWGEFLACEWELPQWHESLITLGDFLKQHFPKNLDGLLLYDKPRRFNSFGQQ